MLAEALSKRREVLLAVIYGGFVKSEVFRDIDITIFTGYSIPYNKVESYEEELSRNLESIVKLPIDGKVIDYAPSWFRMRALDGIILVKRQFALAVRLKFKALQEVKDLETKIRKIKKPTWF